MLPEYPYRHNTENYFLELETYRLGFTPRRTTEFYRHWRQWLRDEHGAVFVNHTDRFGGIFQFENPNHETIFALRWS